MRQKSLNKTRKCSQANDEFTNLIAHTPDYALNETLLANKFIRNSIYYLDMLAWTNEFNMSKQILVLDGERFIRMPWLELNRVERFLGVDAAIRPSHFYFDRRKRFFCVRKWPLNDDYRHVSKCLGKNKGRKRHIYLSSFVRSHLAKFFHQWNERFFDLIGQRFDWS